MASQQLNGNGKLSSIEVAIVNYLKLKKFDKKTQEIELASPEEIAAALDLSGVPIARQLLLRLEERGILKSDRYGNWATRDRFEFIEKLDDDNRKESTKPSNIEIVYRNGKTYAWLKDLTLHPLNAKIYGERNVADLKEEIKRSLWIKTLVITSTGKIISGNTRWKCARELGWKIVPVEVRVFKSEREEKQAFLRENSYRIKTIEERVNEAELWHELETEKAKERQRQSAIITNAKKKAKNQQRKNEGSTIVVNSPQSAEEVVNKKPNLKVRDIVAAKVGLKAQRYQRAKKVVARIRDLESLERSGAAKTLRKTLNEKSTNAAYLQLKELTKVEIAIAALKEKNQDDAAEELEGRLKWHSIKDATELMKDWQNAYIDRSNRLPEGTVVKIKSQLCRNQWAIVDREDNHEFTCNLMVYQGELKEVHKAELETVELTPSQQKEALNLMLKMQLLWGQLNELGDEPIGRAILKEISVKRSPVLSRLEQLTLTNLEKDLTVILTEKVLDRRFQEAK